MSRSNDNQNEALTEFLTRSLLSIIKLARSQASPELDQALAALQHTIASNASLEQMEALMAPVKDEIVRMQLGMDGSEQSGSPLEEGGDAGEMTGRLKDFYLEILGQMNVDLDAEYRERLDDLRRKILETSGMDLLFDMRPEFESLLRRYAHSVFEERKRAADFIKEIASRLAELETHLAESAQRVWKGCKEDAEFSRKLENHVSQAAATVHGADKLEELKKTVLSRLNTIQEALRKKRRRDKTRTEGTVRAIDDVRRHFGDALEKVDEAGRVNSTLLEKLKFDGLTGAYNRIMYEEYLAAEMHRFHRYNRPFSLIIFDIDHFKLVNDGFGHSIGDRCLRQVIQNIRPILREKDILARYGGDEFVILLPEIQGDQCADVAEKVRRAIEEIEFTVRGQKLPLTISVGAAEARSGDDEVESILDRADQALYRSKREGRNRVNVS